MSLTPKETSDLFERLNSDSKYLAAKRQLDEMTSNLKNKGTDICGNFKLNSSSNDDTLNKPAIKSSKFKYIPPTEKRTSIDQRKESLPVESSNRLQHSNDKTTATPSIKPFDLYDNVKFNSFGLTDESDIAKNAHKKQPEPISKSTKFTHIKPKTSLNKQPYAESEIKQKITYHDDDDDDDDFDFSKSSPSTAKIKSSAIRSQKENIFENSLGSPKTSTVFPIKKQKIETITKPIEQNKETTEIPPEKLLDDVAAKPKATKPKFVFHKPRLSMNKSKEDDSAIVTDVTQNLSPPKRQTNGKINIISEKSSTVTKSSEHEISIKDSMHHQYKLDDLKSIETNDSVPIPNLSNQKTLNCSQKLEIAEKKLVSPPPSTSKTYPRKEHTSLDEEDENDESDYYDNLTLNKVHKISAFNNMDNFLSTVNDVASITNSNVVRTFYSKISKNNFQLMIHVYHILCFLQHNKMDLHKNLKIYQKSQSEITQKYCEILDAIPTNLLDPIFGKDIKLFLELKKIRSKIKAKIKINENAIEKLDKTEECYPLEEPSDDEIEMRIYEMENANQAYEDFERHQEIQKKSLNEDYAQFNNGHHEVRSSTDPVSKKNNGIATQIVNDFTGKFRNVILHQSQS